MRFTSTRRGARLARRLCGVRLDAWGIPYGSDAHDALTLIAAELCANAVQHGNVPGRDFHLRLTAGDRTVRVEVTDTRGERLPVPVPASDGDPANVPTDGRGLLLVVALADRWGWCPREDGGPGKTAWARFTLPPALTPVPPLAIPPLLAPVLPMALAPASTLSVPPDPVPAPARFRS
ncbi:ATP-binding protein [Streptomyces europaeiscabiei]|nr:ATP-binding protein [Streptomyces europaeiscabiei]MDX3779741.1 ATP-binding protein [Streptomyces europaeiscabiei]